MIQALYCVAVDCLVMRIIKFVGNRAIIKLFLSEFVLALVRFIFLNVIAEHSSLFYRNKNLPRV